MNIFSPFLTYLFFDQILLDNKYYIFFCVLITSTIFIGGIIGTVTTKNSLIWMICLELIFISSFLNWIFFSIFLDNIDTQIFALLTLMLVAADSVLGLSLVFLIFYKKKTTLLTDFKK